MSSSLCGHIYTMLIFKPLVALYISELFAGVLCEGILSGLEEQSWNF